MSMSDSPPSLPRHSATAAKIEKYLADYLDNNSTLARRQCKAEAKKYPWNGSALYNATVDEMANTLGPVAQNPDFTQEGALETSQDTSYTSHLPSSSEPDPPSTAFTSSMPDETIEQPTSSFKGLNQGTNAAIEVSSSVVQAPISDLRDDPQPATSQQTDNAKEQQQKQDLTPAPELANGLKTAGAGASEEPSQLAVAVQEQNEPAPVVTLDQMDTSMHITEIVTMTTTDIPHHPPVPTPEGAQPEAPIEPAPSPAAPTETQSQPPAEQQAPNIVDLPSTPPAAPQSPPKAAQEQAPEDQVMQDVPPLPAKMARPREEDDVQHEPATKRPKVDGDAPSATEFRKPDLPEAPMNVNGEQPTPRRPDFANPPTGPQFKAILRVLGNVKRTKDAGSFLTPVDFVFLGIPSYPTVIEKPMDLGTLEQKLRDRQYPSITAFISDFDLIVRNCETFNGPAHTVTHAAQRMKTSFDKQVDKLPGADVPDHPPAEKKKKPTVSTMEKPPPVRRESRSLPSFAQSPVTPASPQTFALNPQGVPLIRRDSAVDNRPKREIHPPAPRDLPYANQKPKKKKYLGELRFCEHVLKNVMHKGYSADNRFFLAPVDPVAMNIPDYHKIIKRPMDLGTIEAKLKHGEYENAKEFEADVRLTFSNCYKFNPPDHAVHQHGKRLEVIFDREMALKQRWIENNVPLSGAASPGSSSEASDDEDDDEEDEEEHSTTEIRKLQEQIAAMSKKVELITQKKKSPPAASKKSTKPAAKPDKKLKKAAPAPAAKAKINAKSAPKNKRVPFVTYEEKQDISNRINDLSESKMSQALTIIRTNMPSLKDSQGDELELDIDELPNEVLHELHKFVKKHAPRPEDRAERASPPASAYVPPASAAPARKKNKPMGKNEQESKIKQLEAASAKFQSGSVEPSIEYPNAPGMYPHSPVSIAEAAHGSSGTGAVQDRETSGDEDDSEESEEE